MSIADVEWQLEAEDLARSKRMMNSVLASCNPLNWSEWLADDAVLSLRLGTVDTSQIRDFRGYSGVFRAAGKRQARRMLKSISGGLGKDLSISTEIISGSHIILLGKLAAQSGAQCMPAVIYMALTSEKKIQDMTIAIVDHANHYRCDEIFMIDAQEKSRSPRFADLSAHFLERARHYRFAAAMTENPREIERLCEVALMFEEMARDTERSAQYSRLRAGTWPRPECPSTTECKPGFVEACLYKFVRVGRFIRRRARISRVQGHAG